MTEPPYHTQTTTSKPQPTAWKLHSSDFPCHLFLSSHPPSVLTPKTPLLITTFPNRHYSYPPPVSSISLTGCHAATTHPSPTHRISCCSGTAVSRAWKYRIISIVYSAHDYEQGGTNFNPRSVSPCASMYGVSAKVPFGLCKNSSAHFRISMKIPEFPPHL